MKNLSDRLCDQCASLTSTFGIENPYFAYNLELMDNESNPVIIVKISDRQTRYFVSWRYNPKSYGFRTDEALWEAISHKLEREFGLDPETERVTFIDG